MINLFLFIPGINEIPTFSTLNSSFISGANSSIGGLVSSLLAIGFFIAGFLMFIWAVIGLFQYITAGGNKEALGKARAKFTWAIVGFLLLMASFAVSRYVQDLAQPQNVNIKEVLPPVYCLPGQAC